MLRSHPSFLGWDPCQSPDGKNFYRNPHTGESCWEFPSYPSAPFAPHPSAPSLNSSSASFDDVVVNPDLQSLTDALTTLKIGVRTNCAALAAALLHKGVMCIDDLRLLPETETRDLLERVGFEKIQQLKLMQAVAPPLAAVAAQDAATEYTARMQAAASVCIPALSLQVTQGYTSTDAGDDGMFLLRFRTATLGTTHDDVFVLDEGGPSIVRVRARGIYQLHFAIDTSLLAEASELHPCANQHIKIFVNDTLRKESRLGLFHTSGPRFRGPLIVFDILQLDANDAITVRVINPNEAGCLNLVLLQRL